MKRCGLYTRVSTEDQASVKEGSLDTQMDQLERYVELKGDSTEEVWRVAARYREEGRSGKDLKRPAFQRLLADAQAGKLDVVLCTKFDRISRSVRDFLDIQEILKEARVAFVSIAEQWDTTTPMGEFALILFLGVAQLERQQISARTREKAQWRAEKGLKNGGQLLGYDIDPEHPGIPTVNASEKDLVLLIFNTYLQHRGLRRTAEIINRKGYRTKSYTSRRGKHQGGNRFSDTAVRRILTNTFYIGMVRHKEERHQGRHEPLVATELFERVQRILAANRGQRGRLQGRHLFILDGLVRCGACGSYMTPTFGYNPAHKPYFYYACTRRNHQGPDGCEMTPVAAEPLEKVVAERLIELGTQDQTVARLVKEAMADTAELRGNLERRQSHLSTQRRRVESQIDALVEGLADRALSIKSVGAKIVELEEQKEELDTEALELELELEATHAKVVSAQSLTATLTTFGDLYKEALPQQQRELVRLRVNQLVWSPDEIRLGLLDHPYQMFDESQQLVARTGFEPVLPA